ncbi:MAG: hypothetical protein QGG19_09935 [Alphaproteobacteria bacterium]|nr:hypothetical protein [Rhodospirillaceae bacterium]MDP6021607.1 hypothetical protein [Alphaproteobacteria bacterium]MDP6253940.1 hypothetical protein [Alphaproteobacteria bacterium]MDP7056290.1 hypothetical protein [Alphaproteobacteria bacterium]MDP7228326.1 hypothetical protein [Alphaproteobacteria bacterium]
MTKISDIMAFVIDMEDIDEVFDLHKYKPHLMNGGCAGTYSFQVTTIWRITFKHNADEDELYDLDYEGYH